MAMNSVTKLIFVISYSSLEDTVQAHDGNISGPDSDSENDMIEVAVEEKPKEQWDCESILSEYLKDKNVKIVSLIG